MRYETGTFELRDNDMMMRELSSAETDEVAGGLGTATAISIAQSGAMSALAVNGTVALATTNTSASATIIETVAAVGANNTIALATSAVVS